MPKILVAAKMDESQLKAIAAVHPDIELQYTTDPVFGLERRLNQPPEEGLSTTSEAEAMLREAEVMVGFTIPPDILERAPKLKWVQLAVAGADYLEGSPLLDSGIVITNASGVGAIPIAEWIMCTMLMLVRRMPFSQRNRQDRRWRRYQSGELYAKTLGIIGIGHIGKELARMAKGMGMRVAVTRRTATSGALPENVDEAHPRERLRDLLAASDFVALCVPLTKETERLIGEEELRAMKSTAYLFNVSRGAVVDEPVLLRALKEGWIAGAGLDVFEQEPLPAESELWDMQNVILTPHVAAASNAYNDRMTALICENVRRYIAGEPLLNVVDKAKGY